MANTKRKEIVKLPGTDKPAKPSTAVRIYEVAELIVKKGYTRMDVIDYIKREWGLGKMQAIKYWTAALQFLRPENPEAYREALINRNFNVAEEVLRRALESNNLKAANEAIKILNSMLGVGVKTIGIADKEADGSEKKIIISFND